jgi:hypothetical protein
MQTKNIESLAAFDNAKVVSNHFAVVKKDNKYNVFFMRDTNSQNGELVFDDDKTTDEEIKFVYNSGEAAIINRELDGLYGYMILKGSEVVTENHKRECFFQLVTNSQKYYQIERFDETRDIINIDGNTNAVPFWNGSEERTIMYHWKNLYAIRMENEDNEVYYNVWNVNTDKWLLSDCVDYLRFENIENENNLSILIVDSETIYLVDKNNKEKGGCFPCEYQPNHIELQDKVTINAKDYRTDELYDIVTLMNKDKEECIVRANDNDNNFLFDELNDLLSTKGCPIQIIVKTKQNYVSAYKDIHWTGISAVSGALSCEYGNNAETTICEINDIDIVSVRFIY